MNEVMKFEMFIARMYEKAMAEFGDQYSFCVEVVPTINNATCQILSVNAEDPGKRKFALNLLNLYTKYTEDWNMNMAELRLVSTIRTYKEEECVKAISDQKDQIGCILINRKMNEELLKELPYRMFYDYAVVYRLVKQMDCWRMLDIIRNDDLEEGGITEKDLFQLAKENMKREFPVGLYNLYSGSPFDEEEAKSGKEPVCYILTNVEDYCGDAMILHPDILGYISEKLQSSFFLIPSSIHEWIIAKDSIEKWFSYEEILNDINATVVRADEILGEVVYFYDMTEKRLIVKNPK